MTSVIRKLSQIDWDFSDYRGLFKSYADINSMHWYLAPFVPQIPAILTEVLSKESDLVLDPFAGGGVSLFEAAKLGRRFIGVDSNPHAIDIINAKLAALQVARESWIAKLLKSVKEELPRVNTKTYIREEGIHEDVFRWFHPETLSQLCRLRALIVNQKGSKRKLVCKAMLSSVLQKCCAQKEHYTYVTDNCFPDLTTADPVNAIRLFESQVTLMFDSVSLFRIQYEMMHGCKWSRSPGKVIAADARKLNFLDDNSVDLIVTSPPYLGVNDYARSMRLTTLFFPDPAVETAIVNEIGARRKRSRKYALDEYISDMTQVFSELSRVLKEGSYMALVIGQGRGKVTKQTNVVATLLALLHDQFGFTPIYQSKRKLKFRRIQVPGIGTEEVIVCRKE